MHEIFLRMLIYKFQKSRCRWWRRRAAPGSLGSLERRERREAMPGQGGGWFMALFYPHSTLPGWWFGTFSIFPYIGNNHPNWLVTNVFQRGRSTTNQLYRFAQQFRFVVVLQFNFLLWRVEHGNPITFSPTYPLVNLHKTMEHHHAMKMGKSTISMGHFQ